MGLNQITETVYGPIVDFILISYCNEFDIQVQLSGEKQCNDS